MKQPHDAFEIFRTNLNVIGDQLASQHDVGATGREAYPLGSVGMVILHFSEELHPSRLNPSYAVLPGVRWSCANALAGDDSNFYPKIGDERHDYLLMKGEGDCPSGCIEMTFWYFTVSDGEARLVGRFAAHEGDAAPEWWADVRSLRDDYQMLQDVCVENS